MNEIQWMNPILYEPFSRIEEECNHDQDIYADDERDKRVCDADDEESVRDEIGICCPIPIHKNFYSCLIYR